MATNQQGIAIGIKAFLPMGKSLDEQLAALNLVKTAHETGDYAALLAAAHDVEVKTEQKTRRVEPAPQPAPEVNGHEAAPEVLDAPEAIDARDEEALPFDTGPEQTRFKKKANGNE